MSKFFNTVCKDCEFYESKHDRANTGDCLLDFYGNDGIKTVKADDTCDDYISRTASEEE